LSLRLAEIEGKFKNKKLTLKILDELNFDYSKLLVAYSKKTKVLAFPLPTSIKNDGELSYENIQLNIRYPKAIKDKEIGLKLDKGNPHENLEIIEDGNFLTYKYNFDILNPGNKIDLNDFVLIQIPTWFNHKVPIKTKDKKNAIVRVHLFSKNFIDFSLFSKNENPSSGRIHLEFVDVSEKSLQDQIELNNSKIKKDSKNGFWKSIKVRFKRNRIDEVIPILEIDEQNIEIVDNIFSQTTGTKSIEKFLIRFKNDKWELITTPNK
jgi:hypothetical protein